MQLKIPFLKVDNLSIYLLLIPSVLLYTFIDVIDNYSLWCLKIIIIVLDIIIIIVVIIVITIVIIIIFIIIIIIIIIMKLNIFGIKH